MDTSAQMENSYDLSHWVGHIVSGAAILGNWSGMISGFATSVAAIVAFSWYAVQLYESKSVQRFLTTRRERKIAALRVRLAQLEAQKLKEDSDPGRSTSSPKP